MQDTANNESEPLVKVKDVAAALSVSRAAVQLWIRTGAIPYIPLPRGQYRIKKSVLEALLTERQH